MSNNNFEFLEDSLRWLNGGLVLRYDELYEQEELGEYVDNIIKTGNRFPYSARYAYNSDLFNTYKCKYLVHFRTDLKTFESSTIPGIEIRSVEPKIENVEFYVWFSKGLIHRSDDLPAILMVNEGKIITEEFWSYGIQKRVNCRNSHFVEHFLKNMELELVENKTYD